MSDILKFDIFPDSHIEFDAENGQFNVECTFGGNDAPVGKLMVCDDMGTSVVLGSFSSDNSHIKKSYPLSFLADSGLDICRISHFALDIEGRDRIFSGKLDLPDPAIIGAERVLRSLRSNEDRSDIANECINRISQAIKTFPTKKLPVFDKYHWYVVDTVRCPFLTSAFEHIIFDSVFVRSFALSGEWYISHIDANIFAVCIHCPSSMPNPMNNVSDCVVSAEYDNVKYYMAGVGFFENGQYFCKLENI